MSRSLPKTLSNSAGEASRKDSVRLRPSDIAKRLRREILDGLHPPGSWLRERHIAERFEVSRGPVREALRLLSEERLVELEAFRGARVVQLSREEMVEIFELRAALFALAARFAAERAPDAALLAFAKEVQTMVRMAEKGAAPPRLVEQGGKANTIILQNCGAPDIQAMLRQVVRKSQWHYTQAGITNPAVALQAARYWQDVAGHLTRREGADAERAVRRVLRHIQNHAIAALDRESARDSRQTPARR